jgi:quercetin dioxygenase-like cupin family protein
MREHRTVGFSVVLALVVLGSGSNVFGASHGSTNRDLEVRELASPRIGGLRGKEARIWEAVIAPGESTGRHCHPGHEFIYVVDGRLKYHTDTGYQVDTSKAKEPSVDLGPGDHAYLAPGQVHEGRNVSSVPVKILMFSIYDKGSPKRIPRPNTPIGDRSISGCEPTTPNP